MAYMAHSTYAGRKALKAFGQTWMKRRLQLVIRAPREAWVRRIMLNLAPHLKEGKRRNTHHAAGKRPGAEALRCMLLHTASPTTCLPLSLERSRLAATAILQKDSRAEHGGTRANADLRMACARSHTGSGRWPTAKPLAMLLA